MFKNKEKSKIHIRSNKSRTRLLILMREELKGFKHSSLAKINHKSISEKEREYNDIVISLNQIYSNKNINYLHFIVEKNKIFDSLNKLSLNSLNNIQSSNTHNKDFTNFTLKRKQTISDRKIMNFQINTIKKLFKDAYIEEKEFELKNNPFKSLNRANTIKIDKEQSINLKSKYNTKIDEILDFINVEKGFFKNPNTVNRAKTSFFYLKSLANSLKKIEQKKKNNNLKKNQSTEFNMVQNIMIMKENIDEEKLKIPKQPIKKNLDQKKMCKDSSQSLKNEGKILKRLSSKSSINNSCFCHKNEVKEMRDSSITKGSLIRLRKCLEDKNETNFSKIISRDITPKTHIINEVITEKSSENSSIDVFKINLICLK